MNTEFIMSSLSDFMKVDYEPAMVSPANADGHIVMGNPMRKDSEKSRGVFYDNRWFTHRWINFLETSLPFVQTLNRRWVYGNTISTSKDWLFGR
jgi:hypothetical protein